MNLDRDRLFRAGAELRRITSSDAFDLCVEILREDYRHRIMETSLGESKSRDEIHAQYHALEDLLGVINSLVIGAEEEMLRTQDDDEEPSN